MEVLGDLCSDFLVPYSFARSLGGLAICAVAENMDIPGMTGLELFGTIALMG